MAEFEQNTIKKGGGYKSQIQNFAPQASTPEPLSNISYVKQQEVKLWDQVTRGIGAGAKLVKAYTDEKDKQVADRIIKRMDTAHESTMLEMSTHLQNTEIEDLDIVDTIHAFNERHNSDTPFLIGPRGPKNEPSIKIHDPSLDDYDNIPASQKDRVTRHYKALEDAKKEWLLPELQNVLRSKAKLHLQEFNTELSAKQKAILDNQESYTGGLDEHWSTQKSIDRTIEEAGGKIDPITKKSNYTLDLMPGAIDEINKLIDDYDEQIIKMMKSGAIRADEGIVYQRRFVQGFLKQKFNTDKARNPDGAFNKIIHEDGYVWTKEMRQWGQRGRSGGEGTNRQKLLQTIKLPSSETEEWMNMMHDQKRADHELALSNLKNTNKDLHIKEQELKIYSPEFLNSPDNTVDKVIKMITTGKDPGSLLEAKTIALTWSFKKNAVIEGVEKEAYGQVLQAIGGEMLRNSEIVKPLLGEESATGAYIAHDIEKIKKNLRPHLMMHANSTEDRNIIEMGLKNLTRSNIQEYINTAEAADIKYEKMAHSGMLESHVETQEGRDYVQRSFMLYDKDKDKYVPDMKKIKNHPYRKHYRSNEEMLTLLQPAFKTINEAHYKTSGIKVDFKLTDSEFRGAIGKFAHQQTEQLKAISLNQTSSWGATSNPVENVILKKLKQNKITSPTEDLDSYMTGEQILRGKKYAATFEELGTYIMATKTDDVKPELLNKYYKNIMSNDSKGDFLNEFTGKAANLVAKQLYERLKSLDATNFTDTMEESCTKDGTVDTVCMNKKFNTYGYDAGVDVKLFGDRTYDEGQNILFGRSDKIKGDL